MGPIQFSAILVTAAVALRSQVQVMNLPRQDAPLPREPRREAVARRVQRVRRRRLEGHDMRKVAPARADKRRWIKQRKLELCETTLEIVIRKVRLSRSERRRKKQIKKLQMELYHQRQRQTDIERHRARDAKYLSARYGDDEGLGPWFLTEEVSSCESEDDGYLPDDDVGSELDLRDPVGDDRDCDAYSTSEDAVSDRESSEELLSGYCYDDSTESFSADVGYEDHDSGLREEVLEQPTPEDVSQSLEGDLGHEVGRLSEEWSSDGAEWPTESEVLCGRTRHRSFAKSHGY